MEPRPLVGLRRDLYVYALTFWRHLKVQIYAVVVDVGSNYETQGAYENDFNVQEYVPLPLASKFMWTSLSRTPVRIEVVFEPRQ